MIEICMVIILCRNNARNAKALSKSGGAAVAYTIALWIGPEFLGMTLAIIAGLDMIVSYIVAIVFAVIGAVIANIISRKPARMKADVYEQSETDQQL